MADMHKGYDKELKTIKPQSDIQKRLGNPSVLDRKVDLRVLSLGAGVQSSTILFKILQGEIEPVDVAIFADTGNEPKEVYTWLEYLKDQVGENFEIRIVRNPKGTGDIVEDLKQSDGYHASIPVYVKNKEGNVANLMRTCTEQYKIKPIRDEIKRILGYDVNQRLRKQAVEVVMGISLDEITRVKEPRAEWMIHCYPLIGSNITRDDCKHWMRHNGYPTPPRSACIICPYHSYKEWHNLQQNYPEEFAQAIEFDEYLRTTKTSNFVNKIKAKGDAELYLNKAGALKDIDLYAKVDAQSNLFEDECDGYCGV
tara:strand:- start:682 stop:1614 length:933 start_codon:yes stop_codon:yes gene_type:complete